MKSRDRVCRNNSSHLVSSYVNVDKEPIFYKTAKMTWVANELMLEGKFHFFLECMRIPPDWHLWLYFLGKVTSICEGWTRTSERMSCEESAVFFHKFCIYPPY